MNFPMELSDRFSVLSDIGADYRGNLYRVKCKKSDVCYLVRVMPLLSGLNIEAINLELADIEQISHSNVCFLRKIERINENTIVVFMDDHPGIWIKNHMEQLRGTADVFHNCVVQLCKGVDYIHQHGLCHWDIRPETILVKKSGSTFDIAIIDVGLSFYFDYWCLPDQRDPQYRSPAMYMSPEIIMGRGADCRSDLYSLGVVLFETAAGVNPFEAPSIAGVISAQLNKNAPQVRELNENVSGETNALILRLLAKEPGFRPASASEVALEIASDYFQPSIPPRTDSVFASQSLPHREILTAFEDACSGQGSVVTLVGPSGSGKTKLLSDIEAEFSLSGTQPIIIDCVAGVDSGASVLTKMLDELVQTYPGLDRSAIQSLYRLGKEDYYLQLSNQKQLNNSIRKTVLQILSEMFINDSDSLDTPVIYILRNCHFNDYIFWQFFHTVSSLLHDHTRKRCPALWIIETHIENMPALIYPSSDRHHLVELIAFDIDETSATLSSLLGVTPFPEEPAMWVFRLSHGIPEIVCLLSDIMRNSDMVKWSEGDWTFNFSKFHEAVNYSDIDKLIAWVFENHIDTPQQSTLNSLSLWTSGCTFSDYQNLKQFSSSASSSLHDLLSAGWLVRSIDSGEGLYRFRYSRLQQWVHSSIPAYQQYENHLHIAEYFVDMEGSDPGEIAEHYFLADNRLRGCEFALTTARNFARIGNFELAIMWYQRILDNMPDRNRSKIAQVSYEISQVLIGTRDFEGALQNLEVAEPIMESRFHQKREKANYLMLFGICQFETGRHDEAIDSLNEAISFLPKTTALDFRLKIVTYLCKSLQKLHYHQEVIDLFRDNHKQLPMDDSPLYAGSLLESVAQSYLEKHDFTAAESLLNDSIKYGEILDDSLALIDRYLSLGQIYQRSHKYRQAVKEYERVITLARRGASPSGLARGLCHFASITLIQHKTKNVSKILDEATDLANRINDPSLIAWSSILNSSLCIEEGDLDKAEFLLQTVNGIITVDMDTNLVNRVFLNQADIAKLRGNNFQALEYYESLLKLVEKKNNKHLIATTYLHLARTHCNLTHFVKAEELVGRARSAYEDLPVQTPDCDILEAKILMHQNQYQKARKLALSGLKEAKSKNLLHQQADGHLASGLIDFHENKFESALMEIKAALDFFNACQNNFEIAMVHRHLARLYTEMSKPDKAASENKLADKTFKKLSAFSYLNDAKTPGKISETTAPEKKITPIINLKTTSEIIRNLHKPSFVYDIILSSILSKTKMGRGVIFRKNRQTDKLITLTSIGVTNNQVQLINQHCSVVLIKKKMSIPCPCEISQLPGNDRMVSSKHSWFLPLNSDSSIEGVIYIDGDHAVSQATVVDLVSISQFYSVVFNTVNEIQQMVDNQKHGVSESNYNEVITKSAPMQKVSEMIPSVAHSLLPVLIKGESGTGKSFLAESIHKSGRFSNQHFVVFQCRTIMQTQKKGILRNTLINTIKADDKTRTGTSGSIVLDEINLLSSQAQNELWNLLTEDKSSEYPMILNHRVISTCSESLRRFVQKGSFREDLYRLLTRLSIELPVLSHRKGDIPQLSNLFLKLAAKTTGRQFTNISAGAIDALLHYPWPGNATELRDAIESAVLFGTVPVIQLNDLPREIRNYFERSGALAADKPALRSLDEVEESHIRAILSGTNSNKLRTCEILEISRPTLDRKLEKYKIIVEKKRKR